MGIPYAFHYYYNKYNCENELMIDFAKLKYMNINYLFFDYNSLIHPCAHQILSANKNRYLEINDISERTNMIESDIITNCIDYTRYIINQVINNDSIEEIKKVYLTIDGVAPRSKMNQQRERRYKSEFFKLEYSLWDSNKITPGTSFMLKMKQRLSEFAKTLMNDLMIECIISDASESGEGEHKIMKFISDINSNSNVRACIYGLDADLIMLSLMNKNFDKIILIRDNSFSNHSSKEIDYLDIKSLRRYITNDILNLMVEYKSINKNTIDLDNLLYDYIIICFFLGNDFLEHLPSISIKRNGIDIIMKAYVNAWRNEYLVNKLVINDPDNWKNAINLNYLKDIMYQLKNHESYFFKNFKLDNLAVSENTVYTELVKKDSLFFYNENMIDFKKDDYKSRYYKYYGIKDTEISDACFNYLEGLYWIFGYYNSHIHKNWTWYYKYHNSPFCSDIFEFLRINANSTAIQESINNSIYLNESHVFSSLKQLYMVLPKKSLYTILSNMLSENEIINLNNTLFIYEKYYPDKIYIDLYNKRYLWQSKIFFEDIDETILDLFITT